MSFTGFRVYGDGHLAGTLRREIECQPGLTYSENLTGSGVLGFVAHDITDHENELRMTELRMLFAVARVHCEHVVVLSQVPPGWTRQHAAGHAGVFYQVDTIIVSHAVERMLHPEQLIVGCADPTEPLPLPYQEYLSVHNCPVLQMSYESAEVAKLAINYMLSKQIEAANDIRAMAVKVGADYADVRRVLHNDARIGQHAYLRPGKTNQHLERDASTVAKLLYHE